MKTVEVIVEHAGKNLSAYIEGAPVITVGNALIKKASREAQIIISTQSVNLVDNFEPEDIIVVDRKDNATVFNRLDSENLAHWLEDYSLGEIWEKNVIGGQPLN